MSFSVQSDRSGREWSSASLDAVFAQRRNALRPGFYRMLWDIARFHRLAAADLPGDDVTVEAFLEAHGFGPAFADEYFVPLGASLWSSPPQRFRQFSARFVIEFLRNHAMTQVGGQPTWRVIEGGSRTYVEAFAGRFRGRVLTATPVRSICRRADRVIITDASGAQASFDQVVIGSHADQALRLLDDPTPTERALLSAFPYQRNDVVLHTDERVLPKRRRAWASWNYHLPRDARGAVSVTYCMNRLQGIRSRHIFNVTLNDSGRVRPEQVLRRFVYDHPVFVPGRDAAQRRHAELIGANRTSYCGAYWGYGFHEDGVQSALAVCRAIERRAAA